MGQGNGYGTNSSANVRDSVRNAIGRGLGRVPPDTAGDIAQSMSKISRYLAEGEGPEARQFAPDLMGTIGNRQGSQPPPASGSPAPAPAPASPATGSAPASGPTGRVGEVTRATLNAIDFPSFVGSLIRGTFQAIVDSSIQQMEAYAELLRNVAGTVDKFMQDNVSDGMARDYVADQYPDLFARDTSSGQARLRPASSSKKKQQQEALPSFFQDMGFAAPADIDDEAIEQVIVPATRRFLAESRQRTLATMVLMGINRVVVDDGEIQAKLQFHIDATEAMQMRFEQYKTGTGSIARGGTSPFSSQGVMVNTASLNAQTEMNVRADLTGQVKVKFRSETFPLERFADSAAIQLINSNARVPQAQASLPGQPAAAPAPAGAQTPASPAPAPTPAPAKPPATSQQGLSGNEWQEDTWGPEA